MTDEQARERRAVVCSSCGREIEECQVCDEQECRAASCYVCVSVSLRERVPHAHEHGG